MKFQRVHPGIFLQLKKLIVRQVSNNWCEFKISTGIDSKINPKNEIMWNNRKILIGKKPVFYQTWYDAGITKISDILNQNQKFLK